MLKKILLVCTAAVMLCGCKTVTNLTPSQMPRSDAGVYPFELIFTSKATSTATDSIRPYLIMDENVIPMYRVPLLTNRWEVLAPIPAGKTVVNYRYKINYQYKDFGTRKSNSTLSDPYTLEITD